MLSSYIIMKAENTAVGGSYWVTSSMWDSYDIVEKLTYYISGEDSFLLVIALFSSYNFCFSCFV